jgi:ParB family chromosome partitioning protein
MGKLGIMVAIDKIRPSKTNPRKTFTDSSMQELIASIKAKGIIYPIVCRALEDKGPSCEIIDGERRYRAAKEIGLKEIPVDMRLMNDQEAAEAQLISFEQDEDIHPLDKAEALKKLMTKGRTSETVAGIIGKSKSYVEQSLKLLDLIPPAKDAFELEALTLKHLSAGCSHQIRSAPLNLQ